MKKLSVLVACGSGVATSTIAQEAIKNIANENGAEIVAIVCPSSMATGKYLEMQIRNYFDFKICWSFFLSAM